MNDKHMLKLSELVPLNLASEKAKFFAANYKYNPQFVYQRPIAKNELLAYGKPRLTYLIKAYYIFKKYQAAWQKQIRQTQNTTRYLSQQEVSAYFDKQLQQYGLENKYKLIFPTNSLSRRAVHLTNTEIKIALPIKITQEEMLAILAHEIDTHLLRQHNYEQQIWYKKKKSYGLNNHLRTEEGLAIIHEMIAKEQSIAYKSAINYLANDVAWRKDFQSTFNFLWRAWLDPNKAWGWTVKKKRGLTDTSQKGAFSKDLVYFEGFIEILKYLQKNDADPSKLYFGKIAVQDIKKVEKLAIVQPILLPKIFTADPDLYKSKVRKIIQDNRFLL